MANIVRESGIVRITTEKNLDTGTVTTTKELLEGDLGEDTGMTFQLDKKALVDLVNQENAIRSATNRF